MGGTERPAHRVSTGPGRVLWSFGVRIRVIRLGGIISFEPYVSPEGRDPRHFGQTGRAQPCLDTRIKTA
jgi:hypothetical protein